MQNCFAGSFLQAYGFFPTDFWRHTDNTASPEKVRKSAMSSENVLSNKVGVWVLILLFLFVFYRCSTPNDNKVINEIKYAHPMDSHAIALVRETQVNDKGMQFVTAPLKNGIAVLTGPAAYWVSQDQVYSVNGVAMTWSPSTKKSPEEITYLQLVDAIERYQKIKLD